VFRSQPAKKSLWRPTSAILSRLRVNCSKPPTNCSAKARFSPKWIRRCPSASSVGGRKSPPRWRVRLDRSGTGILPVRSFPCKSFETHRRDARATNKKTGPVDQGVTERPGEFSNSVLEWGFVVHRLCFGTATRAEIRKFKSLNNHAHSGHWVLINIKPFFAPPVKGVARGIKRN